MAQNPVAWLVLLLLPGRKGGGSGVFWGDVCLPLPVATATCTLTPSHEAAAALALHSAGTGKVGSRATAPTWALLCLCGCLKPGRNRLLRVSIDPTGSLRLPLLPLR